MIGKNISFARSFPAVIADFIKPGRANWKIH